MTIGSLFAGIGGLELGLEWAGLGPTVWQVEADPFCRSVLARHWPGAERFDDVRRVGAHNLAPVAVLCGGFPCQDLSVSGKGAGLDGARSGLWSEMARVIGELRPRVAVVENVPALLVRGFGRVLGDLSALGYDAEWDCIPAAAVGAPHRRDRVFVIAYTAGERQQAEQRQSGLAGLPGHPDGDPCRRWAQRPPVPVIRGVGDGLSRRMDKARLKALGNAVVPQVAEIVGRRVMEILES